MKTAVPLVLAAVLAAAAFHPAHADDRTPERPDRASVIVADVFGNALIIGGLAGKNRVLGVLGTASYLAAAPIVHVQKGHEDRAWKSAGLRLAAPAVLGTLGCVVIGDRSNHAHSIMPTRFGCPLGMAIGLLAGAAGAEVADWLFISSGDDGTAPPAARMFTIGGTF